MSPEEMKLDMLVAELDYENRLLRARNERLEREAEQRSQQQDPVGELMNERGEVDWISFVPPAGTPIYTRPPARDWVGLTDVEVARVVSLAGFALDWAEAQIATQIVRTLEQQLREKNQ